MARACLGPVEPGHTAGSDRGRCRGRSVADAIALTQPITEPDTNGKSDGKSNSNAKPDTDPDANASARDSLRGNYGLVAAGRDQQDVVAIHQHQLSLDGGGLAGAAEEVGRRVCHRDELRRKVRQHRIE